MEKIIIYTDGGARGNPGPGGIGVVIADNKGKVLKEYGEYLGENITNNEAEYQAVIFGLKKAKALFGKDRIKAAEVEVRADSELLVKQMNGQYKIMEPRIQQLFIAAWNLKIEFSKVSFTSIPREQNKEA
ncbi:MAG: ribonuclease HI family protein, partial [Candidatus Pacebacteria bacterium]|nr:ribonuclease HI family protein [Candidatus Paceibacterota bacterium]